MLATILIAAVLVTGLPTETPGELPGRECEVMLPAQYVHEWNRARKLTEWEFKKGYPDKVLWCPFRALNVTDNSRLWGTTEWFSYLDKKGRMGMMEVVTMYVPEGGKDLRDTLVHEFMHVLLTRYRHVGDERGDKAGDEEWIEEQIHD